VTRPLFEQYKDALRRGHVAARAGTIDDALGAYAEAARLAPDRAAPHTSSAIVLHRAGRRNDALAAFERALAIAADDEATLRARAATFEDLGRHASAAADLERLGEALEADGRRTDALAAARRAVELTATPARRTLVERLEQPEDDAAPRARPSPIARAAAAPPKPQPGPAPAPAQAPETDEPSEGAPADNAPADGAPAETVELSPAHQSSSLLMDLYDEPVEPASAAPTLTPAAETPVMEAAEESPEESPEDLPAPDPEPARASQEGISAAGAVQPTPEPLPPLLREPPGHDFTGFGSEILIQLEPELPAGVSIPWPAIDLPSAPPPPIVGPPPDPEVLMAEALAMIDGGDPKGARNLLLTAVAVHRAAGRPDAALDVCLQLLALAPGDAHVHLAIAGLQLDRGWRTLATEKIQLLLRLTALTGDTQAEADAHALAAERLRDEPPSSFARA
jgi:tetratricopeptide (TPR) repeat protein